MIIIQILNDRTGTDESANYTYEVLINRELVKSGEIKGHNRSDGWQELLKLVSLDCQAICKDCGLAYSDFGLDIALPDDQWNMISPEDKYTILCATCIAKRASRLPNTVLLKAEVLTVP